MSVEDVLALWEGTLAAQRGAFAEAGEQVARWDVDVRRSHAVLDRLARDVAELQGSQGGLTAELGKVSASQGDMERTLRVRGGRGTDGAEGQMGHLGQGRQLAAVRPDAPSLSCLTQLAGHTSPSPSLLPSPRADAGA